MNEEKNEKYTQHKLTDQEHEEISREIASDKERQKEVAFELGVREAVESSERNELLKKVQGFELERQTVFVFKKQYYAVAASVLLMALAGIWFVIQPPDHDELYLSYYSKYPNNLAPIIRSDDQVANLKAEGLRSYELGNYAAAITSFGRVLETEQDIGIRLYLGLSYIENGSFTEAIEELRSVLSEGEVIYSEPAQWYLALCHLRNGETSQARKFLEEIARSESTYQDEASQLLSEL